MEEHTLHVLVRLGLLSSRSDNRVCHMSSLLLSALCGLFFMGFLLEVPDMSSSYIK